MDATEHKTVPVTVCYWDESGTRPSLRATRTMPVEAGSPVIWIWGRFAGFFRDLVTRLLNPEENFIFRMQGSEVFWFTPVEQPVVLHVHRRSSVVRG